MIGKYPCRVLDIGITKSGGASQTVQVVANIEYFPKGYDKDGNIIPDGPMTKTWFGALKGGATPITLDTLARMGYQFKYGETLSDLANGEGVDFKKPLEVIIGMSTYEGKEREEIKGIYEPGQSGFTKMAKEEAVQAIAAADVAGPIMEFMQKKGFKAQTAADTTGATAGAGGKKVPW